MRLLGPLYEENLRRGLHLFVTRTKHLRESGDLARNPLLSDGFSKYRLALTPRITPSRSRRFFSRRMALSMGSPLRSLISIVIRKRFKISVCVLRSRRNERSVLLRPGLSGGGSGGRMTTRAPFTGLRVLHSLKHPGVKLRWKTLGPSRPLSRHPLPHGQSPVGSRSLLLHDPPRQRDPWRIVRHPRERGQSAK